MRGLFSSLTTRGRSFMAAGGAAMVCGLAIPEPDLVRVGALLVILPAVSALIARRSRYRLSCARRLDPPRIPAGAAHHGDRAGGERLAAAHRRAAGRGHHPVHAGQQAAVRARRDRARRAPGAQLPDPFGQPGQVHHRPAPGPGRGLVRPGGDQPVVQHHQHARGHAEDLPAAAGHRAEQLARRGRRRDADDLGRRRGRRGPAACTRTGTACTGCTGNRRRGTAS